MARIRTIKPEFPQSETIGSLSRDARLLFIQIWTIADDAGRARAASRMLASLLYPYDDDAPGLMPGWLNELEAKGCIRRYEVDGSHYLEICNWLKHQKIDRPSESRLPSFDEASPNTREDSRAFDADLGPVPRTMDHGPRTVDPGSNGQAELIPLAGNPPSTTAVSRCGSTEKGLANGTDWPADYRDQFWTAYPRKIEKKAALAVLDRVRKSGTVPWAKLIGAVRAYAETADPQYTKHPTTWLNKGCWDDEIRPRVNGGSGPPKGPHGFSSIVEIALADARRSMEEGR